MSAAVLLGVAVLGGAGAVARHVLDGAVSARAGRAFPWGILAVNLSGAFLLGVLAGAAVGDTAARLLGTGLLGAYTTFSTWMLQSSRLDRRGAALNLAGSLVAGLALAWAGRHVGAAL